MSKKYKLDRKKFIEWYVQDVHGMIEISQVVDDLVKGSEFCVTAEDVLNRRITIAGKLVGVHGEVLASDCELIYNQGS